MNPELGPRCGECRMGLGVHNYADPQCDHHRKHMAEPVPEYVPRHRKP